MPTSKVQAKLSAIITALFGFIAWFTTIPPEQQSGLLGALAQIFPVTWQPTIALWSKAIATLSGIWMVYKAAHSGPQTPPQNSSRE